MKSSRPSSVSSLRGRRHHTSHNLVSQGEEMNSHLRVEPSSHAPTDSEFQAGLGPGLSLLPQACCSCSPGHPQRRPGCGVCTRPGAVGGYLCWCRHRAEEGGPGALFAVLQILLMLALVNTAHFTRPISCELRTQTQEVIGAETQRTHQGWFSMYLSTGNHLRPSSRPQ